MRLGMRVNAKMAIVETTINVGIKNGNIVIMKMPKPKPVVRCTKLAPMLSRNMEITMLLIINFHKSGCKSNENPPNIAIFANKNMQ